MKKIVTTIEPFDINQNVYIYDTETQEIESMRVEFIELPETIFNLAIEKNVDHINLYGAGDISIKIAEEIRQKELLKYNKNKLKINIL